MAKRQLMYVRDIKRQHARNERDGIYSDLDAKPHAERPTKRSQCRDGPRPCPWVGCRYHLFLYITGRGSVSFPHGDKVADLAKMRDTCALDVAERGAQELSEVSGYFGMSTYGARLVSDQAMATLSARRKLAELAPCGPQDEWRLKGPSSQSATRHAVAKRALRTFFDSPLERKDGAR